MKSAPNIVDRRRCAPGAPLHAAPPLDALRRRLRARTPLLQDGSLVHRDGCLGGRFARSALRAAIDALVPSPQPGARLILSSRRPEGAPRGETLRHLLAAVDATPWGGRIGKARLVAVEVTPRRIHAFWSLAEETLRTARLSLGSGGREATLVLRFHDVTGLPLSGGWDGVHANHRFDIEVRAEDAKRSIDLLAADRAYFLDLGLRTADGRFLTVARSSVVAVPPEKPTAAGSPTWRLIDAHRAAPLRPADASLFVPEAPALLVPDAAADGPWRDLEAESRVRAAYLAYLREGPQALRRLVPVRMRDAEALRREFDRPAAARHAAAPSAGAPAPQVDLFFARLDAPAAPASAAPAPVAATPLRLPVPVEKTPESVSRLLRRAGGAITPLDPALLLTDAARHLVAPATEPAKPAIRIHRPRSLFSALAEAGVDLEAELILRGRVKPGRKLRIGGVEIETGADGSFCVSCILRDGKLHVPVEAVEGEVVLAAGSIAPILTR